MSAILVASTAAWLIVLGLIGDVLTQGALHRWLNPRHAETGIKSWARFHLFVTAPSVLIVVAIVFFALGFGFGFGTGVRFDRAYWQAHTSQHELRVPPPIAAPLPPIGGPVQHAAYLRSGFGPRQSYDQGYTNACVSFSFTEAYTYLFNAARADAARKHHKTAPTHREFAPSWLWNVRNRGTDDTSQPTDYPPLLANYGDIPRKYYGYPDSQIRAVYPPSYWREAHKHRYQTHLQILSGNTLGGGYGLVNSIKREIAQYRLPVLIAIPIFPSSLDAANEHAGHVDLPAPGDGYSGGHMVFVAGFDDHHCYSGTCGFFWIRNSYGQRWAINGSAWLSYRMVAQWGYAATVLHLNPFLTPGGRTPPRATNPRIPLAPPPVPAPTISPGSPPPAPGGSYWYVNPDLRARDHTDIRIGAMLNVTGDRYHIAPTGLLATMGSECALKTDSPQCDRYGYGLDVSFGCCQEIVSTAAQYGICGGNVECVRQWEDVAQNGIELMGHILHDYSVYRGGAQYPALNILWNCGPATGAYPYPSGECASNYYNDFLGWWNWSQSQGYAGTNPYGTLAPAPKPKSFPKARWCAWARGHHRPCPAIYEKRGKTYRLTWAASQYPSHLWIRGKQPYQLDTWVGPNKKAHRSYGFDVYNFAGGRLYCWPHWKRCKAVRR